MEQLGDSAMRRFRAGTAGWGLELRRGSPKARILSYSFVSSADAGNWAKWNYGHNTPTVVELDVKTIQKLAKEW